MIRINLMPQAKRAVGASGAQPWLIGYMLSALTWCVLLGVVYGIYDNDLEEQRAANASLQEQIEVAKRKSAGLEEVKRRLERSHKLEEVVERLQSAREGPSRVLRELSHILSVGGGPTIDEERLAEIRRNNPLAGYNPSWDVRRLWLESFEETDHACTLTGNGKTNEDVAEFMRRLSLSEVFQEARLTNTVATKHPDTGLPIVQFELSCKVNY